VIGLTARGVAPSTDERAKEAPVTPVSRGFLFRELYFPNFLFLNFVRTKCARSFVWSAHGEAPSDIVDAVVKSNGGVATLFVKNGDKYVRVATTVKKEDGSSAVGTPLATNSPALAKLNNGEPYYGDATVFGKAYDAGYEPIKDALGAVSEDYDRQASCSNQL